MSAASLRSMFDPALFTAFQEKDPWPTSHHDLIQRYYDDYDRKIASGEFQPFVYPFGTFGAAVVIVYLCIPHQNRPWLKKCRYLVFAWIAGFAAYCIRYTRAKGMATSFGVGLISAWSVAWVSAILVCNDAQTDFQRIERLEGAFGSPKRDGKATTNNKSEGQEEEKESKNQLKNADISTINDLVHGHASPRARHGQVSWQPYPLTPFIERLDWVLDIFCNFRGMGWNWRTSALPPPPKAIIDQLHTNAGDVVPKTSFRTHSGQVATYSTRRDLLIANTKTFIVSYLALDALKTLMMHDQYFWGIVERPPPSYLPVYFVPANPVWVHIYRLLISMLAIKYSLQTIFSLGPLFFSGILGPDFLGVRAEAWMYPETWAPYSVVLDKGLAGWWSSWWHQTFRFAFQEPSRKICEVCGLDKKSAIAKVVQLVVAFGMSGIVHASGSYTCAGPTLPIRNSFVFFMLQAAGVFAEVGLTQAVKTTGVQRRVPKSVLRLFTFVYVHVWFYYTAHLLCDDFARGGIWLFEPVPVSLFRALGFGVDRRDGWFCWGLEAFSWHRGSTWWTSGIAF
jgi:hypothetical protein